MTFPLIILTKIDYFNLINPWPKGTGRRALLYICLTFEHYEEKQQ